MVEIFISGRIFVITHPGRFAALAILVALILTKIVWVQCRCRDIGTFESEKEDILERRAYLIEKVVTTPEKLLGEMASSGSDSHISNR